MLLYIYIANRHSFGGPIANLVALEALKQRIVTTKNAYVFTLGSPRIGNYAFVKHVVDTRISIHRAVNKRDSKYDVKRR